MISNLSTIICAFLVLSCAAFLLSGLFRKKQQQKLLEKLYKVLCGVAMTWPMAIIGMRFCTAEDVAILEALDAFTYIAASISPVLMLILVIAFVTNCEKLPRWCHFLLIVPIITNVVVWTNPLHHLQYKAFSVIRSEIVFGPYVFLSGAYTYCVLCAAIVIMIRFAIKNNYKLFWSQVLMLTAGALVPLFTSCYATFSGANVSITATPISFVVTLICNYIAIYRLHLLDIVPVATQHILDWIPDGYLILNEEGLVVDSNKHFRQIFGKQYNITDNHLVKDSIGGVEGEAKTGLYHLVSALDSSVESHSPVTYEQAVTVEEPETGAIQKLYYMVDITPLEFSNRMVGFVVIFKDITQVKKTMQQVQESQSKMMEQERLALLGQMVGGLAHNLKTPIMGIAGCSSSIESLLAEEDTSLGDPDVTDDDYREIHGEIRDWLGKIRTSCSYMSDIITAVKGQAANANNTENRDFTLDELIKRTLLLMRHELQSNGCAISHDSVEELRLMLRGDINSLVQVLNNLVSNAIDAMQNSEVKQIRIGVTLDEENLSIFVKDSGPGIPPDVLAKLFQEMTTTKGTKGTGLGLYISGTIIRGKFGGTMWAKNDPNGGAVIGFSIPLENAGTVQVERIREVVI